jgi:hypothetical protein
VGSEIYATTGQGTGLNICMIRRPCAQILSGSPLPQLVVLVKMQHMIRHARVYLRAS